MRRRSASRARRSVAVRRRDADGTTLAQVHRVLGRAELSLLELQSGQRRRIAPGTSLDFPRWHPDGTLLAMRSSNGVRGIVRVRDAGELEMVAVVPARDEPSHWWVSRSPD